METEDETESEKYVRRLRSNLTILSNEIEFDADFYYQDLIFYFENALEDHCNTPTVQFDNFTDSNFKFQPFLK